MGRAVGLDAGEYEVKVVELDGSYRKPRLVQANVDRVSQLTTDAADPEHASSEAAALRHAVKEAGIQKQNVTLGFSSREALFRQLTVPFTGEERIRKVIKFEAEGEIHSASVDDMVIDFHVVEEVEGGTRVLVAGVPKAPLRATLGALDKAGLEPERVDLDTMALYRVADWSGALDQGDAEEAGSRVVLDIGARAVRILVVKHGHLLDMRAIPLGCDSIAEDIAHRYDVGLDAARDAVIHCLATGTDYEAEEPEQAAESESEEAESASASLPARTRTVPVIAVEDARDKFQQRLRRELMRFLVAAKGVGDIEAAFLTGAGSQLPGVQEVLVDVLGCQPQPLDVLSKVQHELSEEDATYFEPRIAVAIGLALGNLGGVKGFNFRQEELAFTRGFDRVKLPLAIASMLALFALLFHGLGLYKELETKERIVGVAVEREAKQSGRSRSRGASAATTVQFTGYLHHLVNQGRWPERHMKHDEYRQMLSNLARQPVDQRLQWYRNFLKGYLKKVQRDGQYIPELALDSGAAVMQQFASVITSVEKQLGRFYIAEVTLTLPAKKGRQLTFKVFFRGKEFREHNAVLEDAFQATKKDADSAFDGLAKTTVEAPVTGADPGGYYTYTVQIKDKVPVTRLDQNAGGGK